MSAGIKSRCRIGAATTEQTLTDQRSQKEQEGAFAPSEPSQNECSFSGIPVKPTAPSRSHGSTPRRVLARGRPSTSSTTLTISTHDTPRRPGQKHDPCKIIIFSRWPPSRSTTHTTAKHKTGGSGAVLCVLGTSEGAEGALGGGYPTPSRSQYGIVEGVGAPPDFPILGTAVPEGVIGR